MPVSKTIADGSGAMPALEAICQECAGEGHIPTRREGSSIVHGGRCNGCRGAGTIATEDGKRLLAFLRRNAMSA